MQLSVLVSADYVLQVEMVSYSHPSNTRSDGQCCDPGNGGGCTKGELCDTYFIYCLMPRSSTATECPNTAPGFTAVSNVRTDGAAIDFSQPTVLGLSNPFNLTGISTAWEVMIISSGRPHEKLSSACIHTADIDNQAGDLDLKPTHV